MITEKYFAKWTMIKSNLKKVVFFLFMSLLLFHGLLERALPIDFSKLFYIFMAFNILLAIKMYKIDSSNSAPILLATFFSLFILKYIFDFIATDLNDNLFSAGPIIWKEKVIAIIHNIKYVIIPILVFYIGVFIYHNKNWTLNYLNNIFFPFVLYGMIQAIGFYLFRLDGLFPWDRNYIEAILQGDNYHMAGQLLRFFGPMEFFYNFGVAVGFLSMFLLVNKKNIINRKLLFINVLLAVIFLCLSFERNPIVMFLALILVWKGSCMLINFKRHVLPILLVACVLALFFLSKSILYHDLLVSGAYKRVYNALTLNIVNDATVRSRQTNYWKEVDNLTNKTLVPGIGIGIRTNANSELQKDYVSAHNHYLLILLGYGWIGEVFFLLSILWMYFKSIGLNYEHRFFSFGVLVAFLVSAIFNTVMAGGRGIIFYMIMGYLLTMSSKELKPSIVKTNMAKLND